MARKPLTAEQIEKHANSIVQDIETSILEDIMEFQGTREELQSLVDAIKDKVDNISVVDLFNEFDEPN